MFSSIKGRRGWKKFFKEKIKPENRTLMLSEAIKIYGAEHDKAVEKAKNAKTERERLDAAYDAQVYYEYVIMFAQMASKELRKKWIKDLYAFTFKETYKKLDKLIK